MKKGKLPQKEGGDNVNCAVSKQRIDFWCKRALVERGSNVEGVKKGPASQKTINFSQSNSKSVVTEEREDSPD